MKLTILFICTVALLIGCASVEKGNKGKAIIRDHDSPHKIVKVDGQKPVKKEGDGLVGYYFPEVVVEPGEHEFTILYTTEFFTIEPAHQIEITITTTLKEGYYQLIDTGNSVAFEPVELN